MHDFHPVQYDCFGAPLEFNGVKYSWWNDRYGNGQYFWSETNTTSHICQCGIDKDCVDPDVKCNCDSYDTVKKGVSYERLQTFGNENTFPFWRVFTPNQKTSRNERLKPPKLKTTSFFWKVCPSRDRVRLLFFFRLLFFVRLLF